MNKIKFLFLSLLAVSLVTFTSCGDDDDPETEVKSIVDTASDTESLSTLVAALEQANLVSTLQGEGPFTVFAPTNDAFQALLD